MNSSEPREKSIAVESGGDSFPVAYSFYNAAGLSGAPPGGDVNPYHIRAYNYFGKFGDLLKITP